MFDEMVSGKWNECSTTKKRDPHTTLCQSCKLAFESFVAAARRATRKPTLCCLRRRATPLRIFFFGFLAGRRSNTLNC